MSTEINLCGELAYWPSKHELAAILEAGGLPAVVGRYSVNIPSCEYFSFEEFGGDLGDPIICADTDDLDQMLDDAGRVSGALAAAGLRHRFELYDETGDMVGYLHHAWPLKMAT